MMNELNRHEVEIHVLPHYISSSQKPTRFETFILTKVKYIQVLKIHTHGTNLALTSEIELCSTEAFSVL